MEPPVAVLGMPGAQLGIKECGRGFKGLALG